MPLEALDSGSIIEVEDAALRGVYSPQEDVAFVLKQISPADMRAMVKRHTRKRFDENHQPFDWVDREALGIELIETVIIDWRGITKFGVPLACTKDAKLNAIDGVRQKALVDIATSNQSAVGAARAESFREAPSVL
jgi:hypothetical protein